MNYACKHRRYRGWAHSYLTESSQLDFADERRRSQFTFCPPPKQ